MPVESPTLLPQKEWRWGAFGTMDRRVGLGMLCAMGFVLLFYLPPWPLGRVVVEMDTSHSPMLSRPDLVADLLADLAAANAEAEGVR